MGSSSISDRQLKGFSDRLQRIHAGGPNTSGTIYMGSMDSDGVAINGRARRKRANGKGQALLFWPFALLTGATAMFAGRVAAFQLVQRPELLPPEYAALVPIIADVTVAAVLMIALGWAFSLGSGMRRVFLIAGFLGVMMGEALIIQQAPDLFVPLFSESYVTAAVTGTAPIETVEDTLNAFSNTRVLMPAGLLPGG